MLITNVNTGKNYPFVCDSWLAVDSVDGRIEKILPVASDEELKQVHFVFASTLSKGLLDGHIWFSVFLRPKQSSFTRVRRVSACLALIFLTMLTNAMFFGAGDAPGGRKILWLGNFKFNITGVIIGIQSSIIVIPPSMLIIEIFRRLRPKKDSTSSGLHNVAEEDSNSTTITQKQQNCEKSKKKRLFMLPNSFQYFAYFLVFACSVSSALICFFYSMMWGPRKSEEWLDSMFTGFFQSILIIQPMKAVFVAVLLSIILKQPVQQEEYEEKVKKIIPKKTKEISDEYRPDQVRTTEL